MSSSSRTNNKKNQGEATTNSMNDASAMISPLDATQARAIAVQALTLTLPDWKHLGCWDMEGTTSSTTQEGDNDATNSDDDDSCVDQITALLTVRVVAVRLHQLQQQPLIPPPDDGGATATATSQLHRTTDYSTTGLCRQALIAPVDEPPWPCLDAVVPVQIRRLVTRLLDRYASSLPFHNRHHAVSVVLQCHKLLDLVLDDTTTTTPTSTSLPASSQRPRNTFGIRHDPILQCALLFAALVHDVEHTGVQNARLCLENDPKALLYNDQSVQEKHSLYVAFAEFLAPEYATLRYALFMDDDASYRYFRMTVISAVLSTDLSSPEQTVVTKSKWKEAFGFASAATAAASTDPITPKTATRRGSLLSNISMPRALNSVPNQHQRYNRRGSNYSEVSDVTTLDWHDGPVSPYPASPVRGIRRGSLDYANNNANTTSYAASPVRRSSLIASQQQQQVHTPGRRRRSNDSGRRRLSNEGCRLARTTQCPRRLSNHSAVSADSYGSDDFAADSVVLMRSNNGDNNNNKNNHGRGRTPKSPARHEALLRHDSETSFGTDTQDSIAVRKNKAAAKTQQQQASTPQKTNAARGQPAPRRSTLSHTPRRMSNGGGVGGRNMLMPKDESETSTEISMVVGEALELSQQNGETAKLKHRRARSNDGEAVGKEHKSNSMSLTGQSPLEPSIPAMSQTVELERVASSDTNDSEFPSFAAESIKFNRKRIDGADVTRRRASKPIQFIIETVDRVPVSLSPSRQRQVQGFDPDSGDSSFSLTPPSSDDEYQGRTISGVSSLNSSRRSMLSLTQTSYNAPTDVHEVFNSSTNRAESITVKLNQDSGLPRLTKYGESSEPRRVALPRRASTGNASTSRFAPLNEQRIDEHMANHHTSFSNFRNDDDDGETPRSIYATESANFRKRLGIRRSMDLSGEAIEVYSNRRGSMGTVSESVASATAWVEEPNYLKASAVLEAILRSADVGHFLQSWDAMKCWSSRMFHELSKAHAEGRGHDPGPGWYSNQIRIIDSYLKPLARQLEQAGVFGDIWGSQFANNVEDIRSHWILYGEDVTKKLRSEAARKYPGVGAS